MLILTRKPGESIRIGDDIVIFVKSISGKTVRLGITAPQSIPVYREELLQAKSTEEVDTSRGRKVTHRRPRSNPNEVAQATNNEASEPIPPSTEAES